MDGRLTVEIKLRIQFSSAVWMLPDKELGYAPSLITVSPAARNDK